MDCIRSAWFTGLTRLCCDGRTDVVRREKEGSYKLTLVTNSGPSLTEPLPNQLHIKGARHLTAGKERWYQVRDQGRHLFDSDQSLPMDWLRGIT